MAYIHTFVLDFFFLYPVVQLSQVKDKEDYGSFEGYEDGAGMYVQYAVANQQGAAKAPPHTSSASNIADLDIVMGSQVESSLFCVCSCSPSTLFFVTQDFGVVGRRAGGRAGG